MKKQLLLLLLLSFALGAMDPDIESVQESRVPSLVQLCVPVSAIQIQKDRTRFLDGSQALPAELEPMVGSCIANMHPVMKEILSSISMSRKENGFNRLVNPIQGCNIFFKNFSSPNQLVTLNSGVKTTTFVLTHPNGETQFDHDDKLYCTCWSPDSIKLAVLNGSEKSVANLLIWDIAKKQVLTKRPCLINLHIIGTHLNWSMDGSKIEVGDGSSSNLFDLTQLLKAENYFNGYFEDNGQVKDYLKQILLLTWIHDTKESRDFTDWRSDIAKDQKKKEIFLSLPLSIQQVMTKQYSVISEREQKESNCLIS